MAGAVRILACAIVASLICPVKPHAATENSAKRAICHVFGRYCGEALRVSWCESHWRTDARNGQYVGLFQMGARERELYGNGTGAYAQARAAFRYFRASGRDWSPWSCRWAA